MILRREPTLLLTILLASCSSTPPRITSAAAPRSTVEARAVATVAFTEGPTMDDSGNIYFSEITNRRIMKMTPAGVTTVFRENSGAANGLLIDKQNRLIACEGGADSHRVTRTDLATGKLEVLADSFEGQPFTSPNDVTFDQRDRLYFTDLTGGAVYRYDPDKKLTRLLTRPAVQRPNGIAISPDDRTLYLVEAVQSKGGPRLIRAYDLQSDGSLTNMRVFHDFYPGRSADGLCIDTKGQLYAAAGLHQTRNSAETLDTLTGIHVFSPAGKLLRRIPIPEDTITNCTFGGADLKTLYVTAGKGLYAVANDTPGTRR